MIPNTNLTMPSSTASTVYHQYKPAINATIGTTINDLFFKILANLQENRTSDRCPQKAEARSQRLPRSYL